MFHSFPHLAYVLDRPSLIPFVPPSGYLSLTLDLIVLPSYTTSPASIDVASVATAATTEAPHLVESIRSLPTWLTGYTCCSLIAPTRDPLFDVLMMAWIRHPSPPLISTLLSLSWMCQPPPCYFSLLSTNTRCMRYCPRLLPTAGNKIELNRRTRQPHTTLATSGATIPAILVTRMGTPLRSTSLPRAEISASPPTYLANGQEMYHPSPYVRVA